MALMTMMTIIISISVIMSMWIMMVTVIMTLIRV